MYPTLPFNFPLNNTSNLSMYLSNQKSAIPLNASFIQKFPIQQQQQPRNLPLQNQMSMFSGLYTQLLQQQRLAAANSTPSMNKFSPMVLKPQSPEALSFEAQMMMARRMNMKDENMNKRQEGLYVKHEAQQENLHVKEEEETDDTDTSEKSGSGSKLLSSSKKIAKTTQPAAKRTKKVKTPEEGKEGKKTRMSWSPNEDALLLSLIEKYGKRWAQLAHLMGGRTGKQVRDRYLNVLVPNINRGKWTDEEDKSVWTLYKEIGPQWCKIAARLDGRTEAQVKNRFYTFLKKHFEGK